MDTSLINDSSSTPARAGGATGGELLSSRLSRQGSLPLEVALHIGAEVAGALAVAHAAGLAHGQLGSHQVWLSGPERTPQVNLLGFEHAYFVGGSSRADAAADPTVPPRSDQQVDLRAVGLMLTRMTAERPAGLVRLLGRAVEADAGADRGVAMDQLRHDLLDLLREVRATVAGRVDPRPALVAAVADGTFDTVFDAQFRAHRAAVACLPPSLGDPLPTQFFCGRDGLPASGRPAAASAWRRVVLVAAVLAVAIFSFYWPGSAPVAGRRMVAARGTGVAADLAPAAAALAEPAAPLPPPADAPVAWVASAGTPGAMTQAHRPRRPGWRVTTTRDTRPEPVSEIRILGFE